MVFFTNLSITLLVSQNVDECHNMFFCIYFLQKLHDICSSNITATLAVVDAMDMI